MSADGATTEDGGNMLTANDVELEQYEDHNDPSAAAVVNVDVGTAASVCAGTVCRPADGGGGGNPVAVVNEYSDSSEGRQSPALEPALLTDEQCYGVTKPYSDFNFVFRDGKLVFGPQIHQLVASIILATFPVVLQTVTYGEDMHPAMHAVTWLCFAATISSLLVCAGTDPGIVPKRYHAVNCPVKQQVSLPDGRVVGIRYCYSCCIYRGPRTHHCGICDNCVDQFDHHCPWTGTCIGWRNYRSFLAFIHSLNLTAMLLVVFAVVVTCDVSKRRRLSVLSSMKVLHWAPAVILGYVFLAVNSVTGLLLVHWYLIVHNLTTAEHLKSTFGDSPNIWDAGCFENTKLKMSGRTDFYVDSGQYRFKLVEVIRKIIAMQRLEADEDGSDAE